MHPSIASKYVLRTILENFDKEKSELPNHEYLESTISHLERMANVYEAQSKNPTIFSRHRARARDLHQNTLGLINGIKFGISFMQHKDVDLKKLNEG